MTAPPRHIDHIFGRFCALLCRLGLEAHTDRRGNTMIIRRRPRRSGLTGEAR